jgi:hypothetical protein
MLPWWAEYRRFGSEFFPQVSKPKIESLESSTKRLSENGALEAEGPAAQGPSHHMHSIFLELADDHSHQACVLANPFWQSEQCDEVLDSVMMHEFTVLKEQVENDIEGAALDGGGQDLDADDEWLKVDELYVPSVLDGICILNVNPVATGMVSLAVTADGRVLYLNGSSPVSLSCKPEGCSTYASKASAIGKAKASLAARSAKASHDVDAERVCSLDLVGKVRGGQALLSGSSDSVSETRKNRLKLYHRKRVHRRKAAVSSDNWPVMSADANGKVFLFLYLNNYVESPREEPQRKRARHHRAMMSESVPVIAFCASEKVLSFQYVQHHVSRQNEGPIKICQGYQYGDTLARVMPVIGSGLRRQSQMAVLRSQRQRSLLFSVMRALPRGVAFEIQSGVIRGVSIPMSIENNIVMGEVANDDEWHFRRACKARRCALIIDANGVIQGEVMTFGSTFLSSGLWL